MFAFSTLLSNLLNSTHNMQISVIITTTTSIHQNQVLYYFFSPQVVVLEVSFQNQGAEINELRAVGTAQKLYTLHTRIFINASQSRSQKTLNIDEQQKRQSSSMHC